MQSNVNGLLIKQAKININQGSDKEILIRLYTKDGANFDLTDYVEFALCIKARSASGGVLQITHTVNANGSQITKESPDELGLLTAVIKAADVANLDVREAQDIFVKIAKTGDTEPKTFHFNNVLNVFENLCA